MIKNIIKSGTVKQKELFHNPEFQKGLISDSELELDLSGITPSLNKELETQLRISEMFSRTIQGEGISAGVPATFLRLTNCTLNCVWCDTTEVWRKGELYSVKEILGLMEKEEVVKDLEKGHRLVITGGSPLLQQLQVISLLESFKKFFGFFPEVEIENECVLMPLPRLIQLTKQWNNSPKLINSAMKKNSRYKPLIISQTAYLKNSWFKFVIKDDFDWKEIEEDFLKPRLIKRGQIILMPQASNRAELQFLREKVIEIAVREGVRFGDRLHVTVWDKKTGV